MTSRPLASGRVERPRSTARLTKGGQPYLDAHGCDVIASLPGRRRAAEGRGVASPRPPLEECTMNRAPTWVRPAANERQALTSR